MVASLARAVRVGKLTQPDHDATLARLEFTTALGDLADSDVVIEAIVEDETEKVAIFAASSPPRSPRLSRPGRSRAPAG